MPRRAIDGEPYAVWCEIVDVCARHVRVPAEVLAGSYQDAVAWKRAAVRELVGITYATARRMTAAELRAMLQAKRNEVEKRAQEIGIPTA